MKKTLLWSLLVVVGLMFMGCPYHSDVAIDTTPSVKIDTKLLGKWQKRSSDEDTYVVTQKDANTYEILDKEKTPSEGSEPKKYIAFISNVGGAKFLNLYENKSGDDSKSYYFYKLEISDETDAFSLSPVTEYITETFTSSDDLKKFVQTNMGLSFFYASKDEYIKVGK